MLDRSAINVKLFSMKYSLLKLKHGSNSEVASCEAPNKETAVNQLRNDTQMQLDNDGYLKTGCVSYCVAEQFGS